MERRRNSGDGRERGGEGEVVQYVLLAYRIDCRLVLSLNAPANAFAPGSPILLLSRLHGVGYYGLGNVANEPHKRNGVRKCV